LAARPALACAPRGDGHGVLVMPGLGGDELSTRPLRGFLRRLGYRTHDWKLGRNLGPRAGTMTFLQRRLRTLSKEYEGPISLIGWSLGGLYARELAKAAPDDVRQVITLGSPFTGPRRASNTWRLYEWLSGDRAEEPPRHDLAEAPPVPTTCIFTRSDGIVAWQCCVERPGVQAENIEVEGSHFGLGHNPLALYAIADRLAQPAGQWKPFRRNGVRRLFYRDPARP
jgi:pimeloyl-ACP methyl ester carboxylesterase